MPFCRAVASSTTATLAIASMAIFAFAAPVALAQQADELVGDPERGKVVYRSVGYCVNCHGWAGDGGTGTKLQAPIGPNLRETELDTEALIEVIGCGIPGTPMPYHDRAAYRDGRCYGMELSDFAEGTAPTRGKTFSDTDVINLVTYLETEVIGLGEPTYEECAEFYDNPDAAACRRLK